MVRFDEISDANAFAEEVAILRNRILRGERMAGDPIGKSIGRDEALKFIEGLRHCQTPDAITEARK